MIDRDIVSRFPQKDFRLKQESSYDRASKNPQDTVGWFANFDRNSQEEHHNFVGIEEINGKKEWVLMTIKDQGLSYGPGCHSETQITQALPTSSRFI